MNCTTPGVGVMLSPVGQLVWSLIASFSETVATCSLHMYVLVLNSTAGGGLIAVSRSAASFVCLPQCTCILSSS
jgi:hypothetical protein